MRKLPLFSVVFALVLAAFLYAGQQPAGTDPTPPAPSGVPNDFITSVLTEADQQRMGLHRLALEERQHLNEFFVVIARMGEADRVAAEYLRRDGWKEVAVSRPQRAQLDEWDIERDWIVVEDRFSRYAVEKPTFWRDTEGGKMWAKMGILGPSSLIDSSGREFRLTFEEKKQL